MLIDTIKIPLEFENPEGHTTNQSIFQKIKLNKRNKQTILGKEDTLHKNKRNERESKIAY